MLAFSLHDFDELRLRNLASNMLRYATRSPLRLEPESTLEHQSLVEWVNCQLSRENDLIKQIGQQMNCLIAEWLEWLANSKLAWEEASEELEEKTLDIQNLQEALSHLEKIVATYRAEYSKVKAELDLQAKTHQHAQHHWITQNNQLRASLQLITHDLDNAHNKLAALEKQRELLQAQLKQATTSLASVDHDLTHLKRALQTQQEQTQIQHSKVLALAKDKQRLISNLHLTQKALEHSKRDIEILEGESSSLRPTSEKPQKTRGRGNSSSEDLLGLRLKKMKLKEDLPYSSFNELELSCLGQGKRSTKRVNNDLDCLELDPYFAHFVLTSQSVKIKEDCEDLLNYDIKPYYSEIVDKRIPMHLWDQWIRNKLRQLKRLSKQTRTDLTSEDDTSL